MTARDTRQLGNFLLDLGIPWNYYGYEVVCVEFPPLPLEGNRPTATAQPICAEV
jgi:hypothetical protein